ncbi:unnamed protein product [Miscanthus lutarioriparius]|uniref:Uncharacterized protein n=1 Tax=Miscanthus lutarioriparius TaxID=422564 RepID=A0A811PB75_9POAL|nr:unnamed protein product [Miscanthus lutarioriparius]
MSHALLDEDPIVAPSSFKLLVAELSNNNASTTLYVQIFSSDSEPEEGGGWGPELACPIVSSFRESRFKFGCSYGNTGRPRPVVLGDTVYWPCTSGLGDRILVWRWRGGVAREAWIADLPPGGHPEKCLAVLPSPADAAGAGSQSQALLGLIGIEAGEIEVSKLDAREWELNPEPEFCPYEVDLLSHMLFVMKQF